MWLKTIQRYALSSPTPSDKLSTYMVTSKPQKQYHQLRAKYPNDWYSFTVERSLKLPTTLSEHVP